LIIVISEEFQLQNHEFILVSSYRDRVKYFVRSRIRLLRLMLISECERSNSI